MGGTWAGVRWGGEPRGLLQSTRDWSIKWPSSLDSDMPPSNRRMMAYPVVTAVARGLHI